MRGRGVRRTDNQQTPRRWAGLAITMVLFTLATACSGDSGDTERRQGRSGEGDQGSKAAAFPNKNLIVTASCSESGDDRARVTVTGWDAQTWEQTAVRTFPVWLR